MNTPKHALSKDLSALVGNKKAASRTDILAAIIRYATQHDLVTDRHTITPDTTLADLLGTTDPIHIKDLFISLRPHLR